MEAAGIEPATEKSKDKFSKHLTPTPPDDLARHLAREQPSSEQIDTDLARIFAAWPTLPEPIRRAMLALAESGQD